MHSIAISRLAIALLPLGLAGARSLPRSDSCGVVGYDAHTDAYFYDDSAKYASYSKCADHCSKDSKCQSFGYDTTSTCMHFNVPVAGNVEADSTSSTTYYDRGCITTFSVSSSKTTTSSTKATTTRQTESTKSTNVASTTASTTSKVTSSTTASTTSKVTSSTTASTTSKVTSSTTLSTSSTTRATTTTTKTTTTPVTTNTKTTSAASSTSSAVTVPSGCSVRPAYTVTNFYWFNSTHNLDCVNGPDLGDGTGCIKTDGNGNTVWCDPKTDKSCTSCGINVCSTGLPPQPLGYGPPDEVRFTFAEGKACQQINPAGYRRYDVGNGIVGCGGAGNYIFFYGSSNKATNTGRVELSGESVQCTDGQTLTPYYGANFDVQCTRDSGMNATCTTSGSVSVPLIRFDKA